MKKITPKSGGSIVKRMITILLAVLLLQIVIFVASFSAGGVLAQTEKNAFYILSERTANRRLYLENEMVQRWSNLKEGQDAVEVALRGFLKSQARPVTALITDYKFSEAAVATVTESVLEILRRNGVTGAFLVLDCPGEGDAYPGVYLRDYDPIGYSENNTDLLLERGLPAISRTHNIPMNSFWAANFHFDDPLAPQSEFFFAPINAAKAADASRRDGDYFYRWTGPFAPEHMEREVIAYSVPIIWDDGTVIGVLGVDITLDYLATQLKYDELAGEKQGAYYLGISRDGGVSYETVCASGPSFRANFGQAKTLTVTPDTHANIVEVSQEGDRKQTIYGAVQPLKLYNANTPFVEEQWALIGMVNATRLLDFPRHIQAMIVGAVLISALLGVLLVILAARRLTRPITRLVTSLRWSDPDKPIHLERIGLAEIDALTNAIEEQSHDAVASAARISKIIAMTNMPVGVFEYRPDGRVFCSRSLFGILDWPEHPEGDLYLPEEEFSQRIKGLECGQSLEEKVYHLARKTGGSRWVQLFYRQEKANILGVFLDVTQDMETKQKIEYERDFDILTGLYNRRAFDEHIRQLFLPEKAGELKTAALIMLDLDNLKYVNDTYGHDCGDQYIQAFARSLEYFYRHRSLVGRRSGDEFNIFLYGYADKKELQRHVADFWNLLGETYINLPGKEQIRVRASGGLAWYPDDATKYDELLRLSDFAMYNIKHTVKGIIQEFDRQSYREKSILIQGQDALNRLLDNRMVRYAFQPVVSAVDGSVYGYEMLMRPMLEQLSDLADLFRLAKAQSKLLQMERLTWFEALDTFARQDKAGRLAEHALVFINSIGSQILTGEDLRKIEVGYPEFLDRIVMEITENEEASPDITRKKKECVAKWHGKIALDDFGTGYNSESVLVSIAPDLVKVDISIIHGIDQDKDRMALLKNLLHYAKARGIRVLAEGVENRTELEVLISCGVDYVQGYYLAIPEFEVLPIWPELIAEIKAFHNQYFPETPV